MKTEIVDLIAIAADPLRCEITKLEARTEPLVARKRELFKRLNETNWHSGTVNDGEAILREIKRVTGQLDQLQTRISELEFAIFKIDDNFRVQESFTVIPLP